MINLYKHIKMVQICKNRKGVEQKVWKSLFLFCSPVSSGSNPTVHHHPSPSLYSPPPFSSLFPPFPNPLRQMVRNATHVFASTSDGLPPSHCPKTPSQHAVPKITARYSYTVGSDLNCRRPVRPEKSFILSLACPMSKSTD